MTKKKLIIVDLSNFIFRAFYAIRPLHAPDGTPVNAVYGVLSMLVKIIEEYQPTHFVITRDTKEESFRKKLYSDYKANRTEPPSELVPQFPLVEELMKKLHFPMWAQPGFEADDLIGSIATQYQHDFDEILIASGDKDLMQFVNDKVKILDTMKDKILGRNEVIEKMGVKPEQIVDYLALIGDDSDNVPGVDGIGPKGAANLLAEFSTLEGCLGSIDQIKNNKLKEKLTAGKASALLSKELVQIKLDIPIPFTSDGLAYELIFDEEFISFLNAMGFKSLMQKFQLKVKPKNQLEKIEYRSLVEIQDIEEMIMNFGKEIGIFFKEENELDQFAPNSFYVISSAGESFIWNKFTSKISEQELLKNIGGFKGEVVSHNTKKLLQRFIVLKLDYSFQYFDLTQAHFILHPDRRHDLEDIIHEYLGERLNLELKELTDLDFEMSLNGVIRTLSEYPKLAIALKKNLDEGGSRSAFNEIDLPMLKILANVEIAGIRLDSQFYKNLEVEFKKELELIEAEVKQAANDDLNLKSPKQVGVLLFEKLGLPVIRKTKTGYSTDADVLQELSAMDISPIPAMLLKYRELDKLISTYVTTLPEIVHKDTQRIHTHFNLANAATGRLSSDNPNLQNIPVRTENGRKLRKGFIPSEGNTLFSADYSQVELRILAHFSQDPQMLLAFKNNLDIHQQTASEIFEVPLDKVTKEQRSSAKAINFGLMYGQTSFGLSQTLKINQADAKKYITNYFTKFSKVKLYLDSLKEFAEKHGYVETMFGRRRYIPEINSEQRQVKAMAERIAINSPIQGTAADIIKIAMKNIYNEFIDKKFKSKMILQVHDELIFDVFPDEADEIKTTVINLMENSVLLTVPLRVDSGSGHNWYDIK